MLSLGLIRIWSYVVTVGELLTGKLDLDKCYTIRFVMKRALKRVAMMHGFLWYLKSINNHISSVWIWSYVVTVGELLTGMLDLDKCYIIRFFMKRASKRVPMRYGLLW